MSSGLTIGLSVTGYLIVAAVIGGVGWAQGEEDMAPLVAVFWPLVAGLAVVIGPPWGLGWCVYKFITGRREKAKRLKREEAERQRQIATLEKELEIIPASETEGVIAQLAEEFKQPEPKSWHTQMWEREMESHRSRLEWERKAKADKLYADLTTGVPSHLRARP